MTMTPQSVVFTLICLTAISPPLAAQGERPLPDRAPERIQASDRAAGDLFACALSLSGDTLLVGSLLDDDRGADSGSAYVFDLGPEGWEETAKLVGADTAAGDRFGFSVDLVGDRALVGAPLAGPGGAAYRFERRNGVWRQTARWAFGEPRADAGSAVAWSAGDPPGWALVGVPLADAGGHRDSGAVLAFSAEGDGARQPVRLEAPVPQAGAGLGWAVAGTGEVITAGAPWADAPFLDAGAVLLFAAGAGGFRFLGELTAPDAAPLQAFGYSLDLAGDLLVVGAPRDAERGPSAGAIYIFRVRDGRAVLEAKIPGATPGDQFGISVAVAADGLSFAVGAHGGAGSAGPGVGYVDFFEREGDHWVGERRFQPAAASAGDGVGIDVALSTAGSGGGIAIGAYKDDGGGADAGAAYVLVPAADLALAKRLESPSSTERPPAPGEEVVFVVEVENRGPDDAFGARVLDAPPDGLEGVTWTCTPEGGARCTAAGEGAIDDRVDLPAGARVVYRVTGAVAQGQVGALVNLASVEGPPGLLDPEPGNDTDRADVAVGPARSDLALAIRFASGGGAVPGTPGVHEVEISNLGPSDAPELRLLRGDLPSAFLDPRWTRCTVAGNAVCTLTSDDPDAVGRFTLGADGRAVFRLDSTIDPGARGVLVLAGVLDPPAGVDPNPDNNGARSETPLSPQGDLVISLAPPPPPELFTAGKASSADGPAAARQGQEAPRLHPGETAAYTVRVLNAGPSHSFGARVRAFLPPGLDGVGWSCASGEGTAGVCGAPSGDGALADRPVLPAGSEVVYAVNLSAAPGFLGPRPVAASVEPAALFEDPVPSNNRAEDPGPVLLPAPPGAPFAATLEALGTLVEGGSMTYEIVVASRSAGVSNVSLSLEVPPPLEVLGLEADAVEQPSLDVLGDRPVVLWSGPVPADGVVTIRIAAQIPAGTRGQEVPAQAMLMVPNMAEPEPLLSSPPGFVREPGEEPPPTVFVVHGLLDIPTATPWGLALLALLLGASALSLLHQRRTA